LKDLASPTMSVKSFVATVAGAIVGFGMTFLLYSWLNPILEARTDWIRELQGLLFTTVPLSTVAGAAVGWALSRPKHRTPARVG
jgi:ribose/xylose/arabinose/galactoside ABC-type transport system permease subunit